MPGRSSWMPYAPQGVKEFDDDDDDETMKNPSAAATTTAVVVIRGGADKSLARLGRKQAKATKLGIYSTYSP